MKKILFLSPQLPYPPISGGTIKSWNMINYLSSKYDLDLYVLLKGDDEKNENEFIKKINVIQYKGFSVEKNRYRRSVLNLIHSYFAGIPISIYRNNVDEMHYFIDKVDFAIYDMIIVDHFLMFQYIPNKFYYKVLLHQHNAEYVMWDRMMLNEFNIIKKILLYIEYRRVVISEKNITKDVKGVLCVAENDIEALADIGVNKKKIHLVRSVGDDILLELPSLDIKNTEQAILYIGTLSWEANVDGLIWFNKKIWRILKKKHPSLKFYIIGKNPPKILRNIIENDSSIILTGFVDDLEIYYQKCRVFVSPLRFGSGIKIKNINALYRGIPTVTTNVGVEGIDVEHGQDIMIANSPKDFIFAIDKLLIDNVVWEKISRNSRRKMMDKYTWKSSFENLEKAMI